PWTAGVASEIGVWSRRGRRSGGERSRGGRGARVRPWSSTAALVALAKGHPGQSRFGLRIMARLRLAPPPERPEVENQASHDRNDNDTDEHPTEHELIVARAHGRAKFPE